MSYLKSTGRWMLLEVTLPWEAASVVRSSKAEMGRSGEAGFDVNREDLLEETRSVGQSLDSLQLEDGLKKRERER